MKAEPGMQPRFSIATAVLALAIAAAVLAAHAYFMTLPERRELGPRLSVVRFEPVRLDQAGVAPLKLAGAWRVTSDDARVHGISGLGLDGTELVALTDSGVVVRFAKPGASAVPAQVRELPGGPGSADWKHNRDSEAIAADPAGRGWWVTFENRNELWLYDREFLKALGRLAIPGQGMSFNTGAEGLVADGRGLLVFPEAGGRALRLTPEGWRNVPFATGRKRLSEAVALAGESLLLVERGPRFTGFVNTLVRLDRCDRGYCLAWRKRLPLAPLDNVEALAVERLPSGATRLWLMTDDNGGRPQRTLLIAADLPPRA